MSTRHLRWSAEAMVEIAVHLRNNIGGSELSVSNINPSIQSGRFRSLGIVG